MANFCFNKHQNLWSYFQSKKSLKSMTDAFLGHPVQQFLQNPEFFNSNFNGFRLPWPSRLQKYVSMCLPNSNVIILLLPCCDQCVIKLFIHYIYMNVSSSPVTGSIYLQKEHLPMRLRPIPHSFIWPGCKNIIMGHPVFGLVRSSVQPKSVR